jgi:hypothetical protein
MYVFAFDRDWTVDVNPHPNHDAVPLEWVRYLAHHTEHAVYAIGNQDLAEEAAIPGVVDIVGRHDDDWEDWLGGKQRDGHYEHFPKRRERLSLIADIHPNAEGYVVVDDIDLGDVDGWQHYHAWEFVPAVERGEFDRGLPWVDAEVVTEHEEDTASLASPDASALADLLKTHEDAPAFQLTTKGDASTRLIHDATLDHQSVRRPAAKPVLECVPVDPEVDSTRIPLDQIDRLAVTNPPRHRYLPDDASPRTEARGLRRLTEAKPESVPVMRAIARFDEASAPDPRRDTLRALRHVAAVRPADCIAAVPAVRDELERADPVAPRDALEVLRHIENDDSGAVANTVDAVIPYLDAERDDVQTEAAHVIGLVAHADVADVRPAIDSLNRIVDNQDAGIRHALYALVPITREHPGVVAAVRAQIGDVIADDEYGESVRTNATAILGHLIEDQPGYGPSLVNHVVGPLEAADPKLRNNAVAFIYDVARIHSDVVEPHLDTLTELTAVDDEFTRINATGAIAFFAEDHPDAASEAIPVGIKRLSDPSPEVRENACYILGYIAPEFAKPALETLVTNEEDLNIRSRAVWALDQIEDSNREVESEVST